jgi:peptide/nickel transport system permease protein
VSHSPPPRESATGTEPVRGPAPVVHGPMGGRRRVGPWSSALRRLRRNRAALAFGALFLAVVILCLLAPVYAHQIARTGPNDNHITETVRVGSRTLDVVSPTGVPIGPTWQRRFLLGADPNGRDVAVRLLYGGRNSLEIGAIATLITIVLAVLIGTLAGWFGGLADGLLSRLLDVIWAFPPVLLGVALGVALAIGGLDLGVVKLSSGSLLLPAVIIGVVFVPYVARPLRGQVLSLREREFIDAARVQGRGHLSILCGEILPNLTSTIVVFVPLMLANAILLEAGLSYLGAGVQDPDPSWGTMLAEGIRLTPGAVHLVLAPGLMLVLAVLGINVLGDGLRDALDPRAGGRGAGGRGMNGPLGGEGLIGSPLLARSPIRASSPVGAGSSAGAGSATGAMIEGP